MCHIDFWPQISVFFPDEFKVGVAVIKRYAETMKENKVKAAILVLQRKLTMYGRQSISETSTKYRMEVFQVPISAAMARGCFLVWASSCSCPLLRSIYTSDCRKQSCW